MYLAPCHRCPIKSDCALRAGWRRKMRGLGLRSAAFSCERLRGEVRKGRRVVIKHPVRVDVAPGHNCDWAEIKKVEVPATITSVYPDHSFTCTVDAGAIPDDARGGEADCNQKRGDVRFRRRMKVSRIVRLLAEPDRAFCRLGVLLNNDQCDGYEGRCACAEADRDDQRRAEQRATGPSWGWF